LALLEETKFRKIYRLDYIIKYVPTIKPIYPKIKDNILPFYSIIYRGFLMELKW